MHWTFYLLPAEPLACAGTDEPEPVPPTVDAPPIDLGDLGGPGGPVHDVHAGGDIVGGSSPCDLTAQVAANPAELDLWEAHAINDERVIVGHGRDVTGYTRGFVATPVEFE